MTGPVGDGVLLHTFSFADYTVMCTNTNIIWKSSHAGHFLRPCEGHCAPELATDSGQLVICGRWTMHSIKVSQRDIYSASLERASDKLCERKTDTTVSSNMNLHMSSTYEGHLQGREVNRLIHTVPTVPRVF